MHQDNPRTLPSRQQMSREYIAHPCNEIHSLEIRWIRVANNAIRLLRRRGNRDTTTKDHDDIVNERNRSMSPVHVYD